MTRNLRYLLLQTRNHGDPMAPQEVRCFARALACNPADIGVFDLLSAAPSRETLSRADMLLLGGSGHYSAADVADDAGGGSSRMQWLERTLDSLRQIHELAKPTFASCWGFQALSRAMGGRCVSDLPNAELGNVQLTLTAAGQNDPVFGTLPPIFMAHAGHEDHVVALPQDAILLASSVRVREQAFRFDGKPIYCTQFHPELNRAAILERVVAYPEYVERIARTSYDEFVQLVRETPEANTLLQQFVNAVFG